MTDDVIFFLTNINMGQFQLHWGAFIVALAFGMFYVYMSTPTPKIVIKYPNPENAGKVVYKDSSDSCYTYQALKTECTKSTEVVDQPVSL